MWRSAETLAWDHPRVCGEKEYPNNDARIGAGSPPRMRGKGRAGVAERARRGITPAYAGKSRTAQL